MTSQVGKKVALGFLVALPVLLTIEVMQHRALMEVLDLHQAMQRTYQFQRETARLALGLGDVLLAGRDSSAARATEPPKTYEAVRGELQQSVSRLKDLSAADPRRHAQVARLQPLVDEVVRLLPQPVEARPHPATATQGRELEVQATERLAALRQTAAEILGEADPQLQEREAGAGPAIRKVKILTTVGDALALWLVALGGLLLYRSAAERKFSGLERRMHARLLETMPVGVCLADEHGLIFYTNPAQDALFGYSPEELIGRHVRALNGHTAEEGDRLYEEILQRLAEGGVWKGAMVSRRKNGRTFKSYTQASNMELPGKLYRVFVQEELREEGAAKDG
jgi:PAS domain S-box-containing protein